MKKSRVWSIIILILVFCVGGFCFIHYEVNKEEDVTALNFSNLLDENYEVTETLKELEGKKVSITGYMAFVPGNEGDFRQICNLPLERYAAYDEESGTILNAVKIVYADKEKTFRFSDGLLTVTGTLRLCDEVDEFGYKIPFYIEVTNMKSVKPEVLEGNLRDYTELTSKGYVYSSYLNLYNTIQYTYEHQHEEDEKHDDDEVIELLDTTILQDNIENVKALNKEVYNDFITILEEGLEMIKNINFYIEEGRNEELVQFNSDAYTIICKLGNWINNMGKLD